MRVKLRLSIHPQCQFYYSGWINCESDSSKKSQKIKKFLWSAKASALPSTINHHWLTGTLILGTEETRREITAHSPALSTSLLFYWIESAHRVRDKAEDLEYRWAPSITSANRRCCTSELYKPHKPKVQCLSVWAEPTYLAVQST